MNEGYSELELCPMCFQVAVVTRHDEDEGTYSYCRNCNRQDYPDEVRETPLGEQIDGGQEPYDGGGWPGDGSGTDDLADYNQNEANDYQGE